MERYKKLQAMRQQNLMEKRLTELTSDDGPCASTSGTQATSTSSSAEIGGGSKRVAPQPRSGPVVPGKAKKQLLSRQTSADR